ncbi:polyprenyl synthetase family protein [Ferviditalea candida]|uniref:Polyprenyl synthetase family protein n=1 Tax=Ferviditalea candida TaxID=3108399 RepID=A0ABU5ZMT3_9BACL|nr:polyprenyl synthetase family protein [Paenibacillaceae bacterium T2]
MKLLDIYSSFKQDIAFIERALEQTVQSDHPFLTETSIHLLKAGGKRIRPVFVLLSGQFGEYDLERLSKVAVALELIHMATLVHDDVIDDADTRRGELTVKSKWDNRIAMYTGDYIFAKALTVISQLGEAEIHRSLSKAIVEMCIGEIEQIRYFFRTDQTVRDYLLRIRRKTALLIAISCKLGAMAAGASESVVNGLYSYGYNVGMAFQIRDDILDLTGNERQLGKPPGSDVKQGNITLPVILAIRESGLKQNILREIERIRQSEGQADAGALLEMVRQSGGIRQSDQLAAKYIRKAVGAIAGLSDGKAKKSLVEIAHFVGSRSY